MRVLEQIAGSIRTGQVHPTTMLNTLIETENAGGLGAVRLLERELSRSAAALEARQHPHHQLAGSWLKATRAYLLTQAEMRRAS